MSGGLWEGSAAGDERDYDEEEAARAEMAGGEDAAVIAETTDEPASYEDVNRWVAARARALAQLERLRLWFSRRESRLKETVEYLEGEIAPYALGFRAETGDSEMPVLGGVVRIRKKPPRVFRDDEKLAAFAESKGWAGNPDYQKAAWRFDKIVAALEEQEAEDGKAEYVDPETGEVVEGVEKVWPNEYSVSVSAKLEEDL